MTTNDAHPSLLNDLAEKEFPGPFHFLDRAREYCVLVLCARMARLPVGLDGPARQGIIRRFLSLEPVGGSDLHAWMRECFGGSLSGKTYDLCRKDADEWLEEGVRVAEPAASVLKSLDSTHASRVGDGASTPHPGEDESVLGLVESRPVRQLSKPASPILAPESGPFSLTSSAGCFAGTAQASPVPGKNRGAAGSGKSEPSAVCGQLPCPTVLFVRGDVPEGKPWVAVFNSRKPKSICPDSSWLPALRFVLGELPSGKVTVAGSTGTLTYDLVTAHAMRARFPLVVIAPFSILESCPEGTSDFLGAGSAAISCLVTTNACPGATRLRCRDRLLASLSHVHLAIELRRGGNLLSILEEVQTASPRPLITFDPVSKTPRNAGNYQLLEKFPASTQKFDLGLVTRPEAVKDIFRGEFAAAKEQKPARQHLPPRPRIHSPHTHESCRGQPDTVGWGEFLFHYTRACPGPWPGQSRTEYLLDLLDADPLSTHTALDTLVRILLEWRIRSGNRLVRGTESVVCWSSLPPGNYSFLRKWNSSLARWTLEPYGVAVSRRLLRGLGVKPVIYGRDDAHAILSLSEKFRFQLSKEGRGAWRNEREWRSRGDFEIDRVPDGKWFAFVPSLAEKEKILGRTGADFPVIAFEENLSEQGD